MARVKFYGVRGSISVSGEEYLQFGGNTTCVLLEGPHRTVILDAGTGIRELGKEFLHDPHLGIDRPCVLAFSHFHWDHIQGLPFFKPAYDARRKFIISAIGKERSGMDLHAIFGAQMQEQYFPVTLDGMGAQLEYVQSVDDKIVNENAYVSVVKHKHPGGAYSYRIEDVEGKVLVYCTDIEHGETLDPKIVELARGADVLIHEGQYTPEELPRYRGWGHSSWAQAVAVAEQAKVKQLVVTHHDPDHNDAFLLDVEKQCQARFPNTLLAREKMDITF